MLHTKFQGHRSIGSGEEDFLRFLPYMGMAAIICNLGSARIDNATYQVSRSSVYWFWRRRFFKVFTIYGHGGHVGYVTQPICINFHVTQLICINFHSLSPLRFHMSFGSIICNLGSARIDNATYQVSRSSVYWFWRRRFFKVFTIYGHGGHVGYVTQPICINFHVTQLICINFHSLSPLRFHMSFGSKLPNCFCEKQVLT